MGIYLINFERVVAKSGVVTVTERDVARVSIFQFPSPPPLWNNTSTININMQPTDILDFSSQNDYDYLGHLEDEILARLDCTFQPSVQHQEDDFDDYMNQLCGYMLP